MASKRYITLNDLANIINSYNQSEVQSNSEIVGIGLSPMRHTDGWMISTTSANIFIPFQMGVDDEK